MYKKTVFKYFKTNKNIAEILGITHAAVCSWGPVIPQLRAVLLERLTDGELEYNPELYKQSTKK
ncbi:MAG: Cro/Cl family transcriptional regulator [Candidatus Thiodiazotropha sp. (ex Lucinoma aequizonata)]|nr:Cro/Cl family transcriptional regulator [Candidatus Thiodiazotropha sp. (ex Lucinoma aequizonata)]MCU7889220.1 Cro/Cl family transcriptional regulator [Candidatus Thiodiazotropha sp. (ex Lucinoma aequizonata)]MCU7896869.1 Cro/Cl family transcriptional regulator [Candidatus Thiodiazotropha sp. (ex Lucinoma aequizonata)]MCU7900580.1 Cro/Cl family transcriptional regulator [Candidatus Thiodiazotropha sp. (ex Lucinoma aequizonata)]MCU7900736.1 Cro/Cl family transcriptional regulator [Candidatus 